jgi:hypothetical protein
VLLFATAAMPVRAQEKSITARDVQTIAELLEKSKVFVDYRKFRQQFEDMNQEAGQHLYYYDDYLRLNAAYNDIQIQYNSLLFDIKKDLSNLSTIRQMTKKPQDFAMRYLDDYNQVIRAYEDNYLPIYRQVTQPDRSSIKLGKAVTPAMILLGIEVFLSVVDLIQSRKGERDGSENAVLSKINEFFVKKIQMQSWEDFNLPVPNKTSKQGLKSRSIFVQAPLVTRLEGALELIYLDNSGKQQRMQFGNDIGAKDIGVDVLRSQHGKIEAETRQLGVVEYRSFASFPEGTQFQVAIRNTGGMYVLTLNSGNKIKMLYPYANENLRDCAEKLGTGKDIDVLPPTFVVGRNAKGETFLPAPDCSTMKPTPRYFTIQAPKPKSGNEQFCILITKAELDIQQLSKQLEKIEGNLSERLVEVLGPDLIQPDASALKMKKGQLSFNATKSKQSILPVLFTIQRL